MLRYYAWMTEGTVNLQVVSWLQTILSPILSDILSFLIAIFHLSVKNAEFRKRGLCIVEE